MVAVSTVKGLIHTGGLFARSCLFIVLNKFMIIFNRDFLMQYVSAGTVELFIAIYSSYYILIIIVYY